MITNLASGNGCNYEWVDITNPSKQELEEIAKVYGLHKSSVHDCLQPGHLPKYERFKDYTFIITRVYHSDNEREADTVQEITNKIAIFISDAFIITIHSKAWPPAAEISKEYVASGACINPYHVLNEIVKSNLLSYDAPGIKLTHSLELYETEVFLADHHRQIPFLKGLYFIKRKIDVIRRMLLLTYDIIDQIDPPNSSNAYTRDIRDLYIKQKSLYDSLSENANHLLNVYFQVSAQKTNEIIRVLTIFSVFFMPLTFIVGIYGMNFHFMPELGWKHGYLFIWIVMALVVVANYIWFRKKKWL
jgi:magnesium transporter